jgi:two-component system cell cycle sensor histidine kinase/response regulator CckA
MPARTVDFGSVLARLVRSTVMEDGDLSSVLRTITEAAAATLQVERVNIWLFDRARTRIRCIQAYERGANRHTQGDEILASVAPSYFVALAELRTVAAFDARNDPRTRELANYLEPRGITTLLDAPLYQGGGLAGVVCHEHVGPPRQWSRDEQAFAGSVGDLVSLAIETDRRIRAERSLREGEELFRAVGDRLHDAMLLVDASAPSSLTVRYANEAACRLSGYSPSELNGQPITLLADPAARVPVDEQIGRVLAGEVVLFDSLHRRKDGSVMPVEIYGRAIDCAGRLTLLLLGRDISRRVRAEQAHLEFQAKILEAQRRESLGILAGGIAHEFGNLMTTILANLELARLPESSPARDRVRQVVAAANVAADLCHKLQAYSGRARFVMASIDLVALVDELLRLMRAAFPDHVTVEQDLPPNMPGIEADAEHMRLMVMSLITNAVEAIGDRPGTIAVRARLGRFTRADFQDATRQWQIPDGDYVCLEISDSGSGMGKEMQRRMLEPFFTTKVTGRGLGLPAVHGIVRAHRGAFVVTSEIGRGTTVRVFLPVASSPSAIALRREGGSEGEAARDGHPRHTILVVDDEPLVREVATLALEGEGFAVVSARDGREALHLIDSRDDIATVILDLYLPDVSAEEMVGRIRRRRPSLPLILSSGHQEDPIVTSSLREGIATFLPKPWELSVLLEVVSQTLAGATPP